MDYMNQGLLVESLELKNRVVVPPMASETATLDGKVTKATLQHYRKLAQSGAGLVMVEYSYVDPTGRSEEHQLGIDSDDCVPGLTELAKVIHESGALAAIQLTHSGAKSSRTLTGGRLLSPSGVVVPVKGQELETPDVATLEDIQAMRASFLAAAERAVRAGFDIVEFHSAHGYGLNQWLSPITNKRTDDYGGSTMKRAKLLFDIVSEVKARFPQLVLSVRIPGQDHAEGGMRTKESRRIAVVLEARGAGLINVSSGVGGWRRPGPRIGEGYLVEDAELIQRVVRVPVIGVGGIESRAYINEALERKKFSLAAVGRAILNDPTWGSRVGLK